MTELEEKIDGLWNVMKAKSKEKDDDRLAVLQALKCTEELGEVADIVLRDAGIGRAHKEMPKDEIRERMGEEIADTILSLYLLAKNKNIDIDKCLKEKIEIEIDRWKQEK